MEVGGVILSSLIGQKAPSRSLSVVSAGVGRATYISMPAVGYAGYATPTDLLTITGSASKVIRVQNIGIFINATAGGKLDMYYVKRSTANTGGTSSAPASVSLDSANAAASATLALYTAAPTLGTGAVLAISSVLYTAAASAPGSFQMTSLLPQANASTFAQPVTLRGVAESLCLNLNSVALPAGFSAIPFVIWNESDD